MEKRLWGSEEKSKDQEDGERVRKKKMWHVCNFPPCWLVSLLLDGMMRADGENGHQC